MVNDMKDPLYLRWGVLAHLLKELKKKYEDIPKEMIRDLQYARALTNFYLEDPTEPDRAKEIGRIDSLLNTVERNLLALASNEGEEYV